MKKIAFHFEYAYAGIITSGKLRNLFSINYHLKYRKSTIYLYERREFLIFFLNEIHFKFNEEPHTDYFKEEVKKKLTLQWLATQTY